MNKMANNMDMDMDVDDLKETELSDFPDEVLMKIMIFLNDTTLLNMTRVSKRFRGIAKDAFKKKYSHTYFEMHLFHDNVATQRRQYQPFICTFGENLIALYIHFESGPVDENHWIYTLIQRYCTNLEDIKVDASDNINLSKILRPQLQSSLKILSLGYSTLTHHTWSSCRFENLIRLDIDEIYNSVQQQLVEFIQKNVQLEDIRLKSVYKMEEPENYLEILNAIQSNCKNIHTLIVVHCYGPIQWNNEMINILCKLTTLHKLKIDVEHLKITHLESIVRSLDNLSFLTLNPGIRGHSDIHQNLNRVISLCQNVAHLEIDNLRTETSFELFAHTANEMQSNRSVTLEYEHGINEKILITKGEVKRNKIIVYKKDAVNGVHSKNLLDLNDDCFGKIIGFLGVKSHAALYDTCRRARSEVKKFYHENTLVTRFDQETLSASVLWCLGEFIKSMVLHNTSNHNKNTHQQIWTNINHYCTNLNELTILSRNGFNFQINVWPLKKLIFSGRFFYYRGNDLSEYAISYEKLRLFICPMLTHLEILSFNILGDAVQSLDHGDSFRNLTVLKFGHYNEDVKKFLAALDDRVCEQMLELSIGAHLPMESEVDHLNDDEDSDFDLNPFQDYHDKKFKGQATKSNIELINIVSRFRKLTTLYLVVRGVDCCDTKYLFENCTNLNEFGVWCWGEFRCEEMFRHIYENCDQIKKIRLFGIGIFRKLIQRLRTMFPTGTVEVAIQNNVAFPVNDDSPRYDQMVVSIPDN
ncbi:uncharacterized protein LOC116350650 [Contarinia nasturtii]|uniref:uncharacterized protein LOC116350650 n=1 Tax=Contarinia nasturtii TaxID=265458 RepID=UPI0012D45D53|nr:uncharacterized protein LOC116350650 [Contarinia nasturtii]